ncbi:MAG: YceI family protein [Gammaproteobacteria bacterium]|nr:YceI family protein [Gammaproteobacteria bacterium]NIM73432.1 YceI family protein [Gammaproteobacteria bacterium]NIN39838.1 YceI family protein [Gammaproteobacteria bacterium]NIO25241.1 YceI family protein [Gammaproteobacteria bacterium]NIO65868.1 YceI family protein [Gammaproteobacteria bacterium]
MRRELASALMAALVTAAGAVQAADYRIDPSHSFVRFKIQHLGYSWMWGGFNDLEGDFSYDPGNPATARIAVTIRTASVDTNHAERDKHLRSDDFLDVKRFPTAAFTSTKFLPDGQGGKLEGELTLHGVTRTIVIDVEKIGEGPDPWGGYRAGFMGTTSISRGDFGMSYDLGPKSESMSFELGIEGIRK